MDLLPWPPEDRSLGTPYLWARRFGAEAPDLDLPGGDRADTVTRLLSACLRDAAGAALPEERVWEASLSWRLQGLLATACATQGRSLAAAGACALEGCGQPLEFELDLAAFAEAPAPERLEWRAGGSHAALRLPTGKDQKKWSNVPAGTGDMAASLVTEVDGRPPAAGWSVPGEWLEGLSARLEAADPLTILELEVACPHCGQAPVLEADLEGLLVSRLLRERKSLLRQVCSLATAFHWSEAEILSLSPSRRAHYLNLLAEA